MDQCKRLAPTSAVPLVVVVGREAVGRAFNRFARADWSTAQLDDWGHFVRWGLHPEQLQTATDGLPPVKEGEIPVTTLAGVDVLWLDGDRDARHACEEVLHSVCCLVEDLPDARTEAALREMASAWVRDYGQP